MPIKKPKLDILTSMRGIMILYIVFFHLSAFSFSTPTGTIWGFTSQDFAFNKGYVGVDFFFILSTFVFLYQYNHKNFLSASSYISFQIKRFLRMYPLHILTLICFTPIEIIIQIFTHNISILNASTRIDPLKLLGHLTLTQAWGWFKEIEFNVMSWYISAQFFLYLIMPFFCYFYKNFKVSMIIMTFYLWLLFGFTVYTYSEPIFGFNSMSSFITGLLRPLTDMFMGGGAFWIYTILEEKQIKTNAIFIFSCLTFIGFLVINYYDTFLLPDVVMLPIIAGMIIGLLCATDEIKRHLSKE